MSHFLYSGHFYVGISWPFNGLSFIRVRALFLSNSLRGEVLLWFSRVVEPPHLHAVWRIVRIGHTALASIYVGGLGAWLRYARGCNWEFSWFFLLATVEHHILMTVLSLLAAYAGSLSMCCQNICSKLECNRKCYLVLGSAKVEIGLCKPSSALGVAALCVPIVFTLKAWSKAYLFADT